MFDFRQLNVAIELWGVLFCLIGLACTLLFTRPGERYRASFVALFLLELVTAGGDALAGLFRGKTTTLAWAMTHIGNYATFIGSFALLCVLTYYLCARIEEAGGPRYATWTRIVIVASAILCLLSFLGVFFTIDEANIYHRTSFYPIALAIAAIVSIGNAVLVLRSGQNLEPSALACMLFYTLAPSVAALVQASIYGINFIIIAGALGIVILFLEMQTNSANQMVKQTRDLALSRVEVADSRIAVMVSQIQPHFLFNTLDTIYGLCEEDANLAQEAIASFSRYLRTNLKSLGQTEPVPIETEMEHVKTYLELERMADEDRLSFEIDMQSTGFLVPALSVQVLAENAVKHGVSKNEAGGRVIIRTRTQPSEYTVSVVDNGVGFDVPDDISTMPGVGLANTQARLRAMCNGWLEVLSEPGEGTTAVVHIPRMGNEAKV